MSPAGAIVAASVLATGIGGFVALRRAGRPRRGSFAGAALLVVVAMAVLGVLQVIAGYWLGDAEVAAWMLPAVLGLLAWLAVRRH